MIKQDLNRFLLKSSSGRRRLLLLARAGSLILPSSLPPTFKLRICCCSGGCSSEFLKRTTTYTDGWDDDAAAAVAGLNEKPRRFAAFTIIKIFKLSLLRGTRRAGPTRTDDHNHSWPGRKSIGTPFGRR